MPLTTKMAVEKLIKFSQNFYKIRNNSLLGFSYSINSVVDWLYKIFGGGSTQLLLNGNFAGAKCLENAISGQTKDPSNTYLNGDILWMAVPKKRTSKKVKWLRHQRKFIKNREDIETCSVCGSAKLMNHLCGTCFERIQQSTEEVLKDIQNHPSYWRPSVPENLKQFYRK